MFAKNVAAKVSALAARQWGLFTTPQAEAEGITRLQLARFADTGAIERLSRGIYAVPAAVDEHTPLRAAWLSLNPTELAEDRLRDPVASGVASHTSAASLHGLGDLLSDTPELTTPTRKQSRRGIRLHTATLSVDEVTIAEGVPVTTPARTIADLLRDGHDRSHVAEMAGEAIRLGIASRSDLAAALEPLARRNGQPDGTAMTEHLLDLAGFSAAALAADLMKSSLGKAIFSFGQQDAIDSIIQGAAKVIVPEKIRMSIATSIARSINVDALVAALPTPALPAIDMSAITEAMNLSFNSPEMREALHRSVFAEVANTGKPERRHTEAANGTDHGELETDE